MKRRILFLLTALMLLAILAGCGNSVKTEEELVDDLNNASQIFMVEGSQVTELSIIKRLTDKDNKTDTVYVSILIDHPNATESRAYVMNYTLYNEGWILDDVEDYYGDEAVWKVSPKGAPTNEQVMAELIACSNAQIDAYYEGKIVSEALTHTYFFEEGKYATKIYTGQFTSDADYTCLVETERVFKYAYVQEDQLLHFWFDNYAYEWKLCSAETTHLWGDWYLEGEWLLDSNNATIQLLGYDYGEYYAIDGQLTTVDGKTMDFTFELTPPSSQKINVGWTTCGWMPVCLNLEVSPDMLLCYDYGPNEEFELVPMSLVERPPALDKTGIIDCRSEEFDSAYIDAALEFWGTGVFDFQRLFDSKLWHPAISEDMKVTYLFYRFDPVRPNDTIESVTHMYTEVWPDRVSKDMLQNIFGITVSECVKTDIYVEYISNVYGESTNTFTLYFVKDGEHIYIIPNLYF